jgi:hypothetical protein
VIHWIHEWKLLSTIFRNSNHGSCLNAHAKKRTGRKIRQQSHSEDLAVLKAARDAWQSYLPSADQKLRGTQFWLDGIKISEKLNAVLS